MNSKSNLKNNILLISIFVLATLSVSVANLFGGSYSPVAIISVVLSTFFVLNVLNKNEFKENKLNLILVCIILFLEVFFFVINDIVGYAVYSKNKINFISGCVIFSQLFSAFVTMYLLVKNVFSFSNKNKVELVEEENKKEVEEEKKVEEEIVDDGSVEELRKIPQSTIKKEAPFMEEEK